jgi:hypothetical protein
MGVKKTLVYYMEMELMTKNPVSVELAYMLGSLMIEGGF